MMKILLLIPILGFGISCAKPKQDNTVLRNKEKLIDSLKTELKDCQSQAHIMAEVLEEERIELAKKSHQLGGLVY